MYNILICDDERDIVNALKIYLTSEDYRLFEAYSGLEALEIASREELHLVLMDIMMPGLDGISAMQRLREKVDAMEELTASDYWPLPTYGDMMFRI